jgi:Peptidase family M28/PA domain
MRHLTSTSLSLALTFLSIVIASESLLWSTDSSKYPLQDDMTSDGLMKHLSSLDVIGKANGGNRAFGLPGYAASVDYVLSQISNLEHVTVWTQNFTAEFKQEISISFRVGGKNYSAGHLSNFPSSSDLGITAPLVLGPSGYDACSASAYGSLDVKNKLVLVEQRNCTNQPRWVGLVVPAAAAGAAGVIIYESPYRSGVPQSQNQTLVPAGIISQKDGQALVQQLKANGSIPAYFQETHIREPRVSQNIFAETKTGDPSNIIMIGAHLDSVQDGPGINDDGSGVTLLLEILQALQKYNFKNKIRLAWWGAEEEGYLGSNYYVGHLNNSQSHNLLAYLNFDMIGRGYYGIFDGTDGTAGTAGKNTTGPPGSEVLYRLFLEAFTERSINGTVREQFLGNSDYKSFVEVLKIPSGGVHTGTMPQQDPCYHQQCDNIDNIHPSVLITNAQVCSRSL